MKYARNLRLGPLFSEELHFALEEFTSQCPPRTPILQPPTRNTKKQANRLKLYPEARSFVQIGGPENRIEDPQMYKTLTLEFFHCFSVPRSLFNGADSIQVEVA